MQSIKDKTHQAEFSSLIHQAGLNPHLSLDDLNTLCDISRQYNFAGFCTDLTRLSAARKRLGKTSQTKLVAVIGFPFGFVPSQIKCSEAEFT